MARNLYDRIEKREKIKTIYQKNIKNVKIVC